VAPPKSDGAVVVWAPPNTRCRCQQDEHANIYNVTYKMVELLAAVAGAAVVAEHSQICHHHRKASLVGPVVALAVAVVELCQSRRQMEWYLSE
jgi:hypothetical protein